ncbi:MAG: dihydrodipicolinate synthase family protein [Phycisphaeraceae bacterium]|nr:dihydrodipicolinate synthase family protein [Phycisphaeraceae bacterium]
MNDNPFDTPRRNAMDACPPHLRDPLTGPCPSVRTPFTSEGEIDEQALLRQLERMLDGGARCVILTAGDSLFSLLDDSEIEWLTRRVAEYVRGRAMMVAATNTWPTQKAAEFASWCSKLKVDMLMVLPPDWAMSCTAESLVAHYGAVAEHMPVMVVTNYLLPRHMPFRLALVETLLSRVPGVRAFKDDVGGEFAHRLCLLVHDRCAVIAGGQKQSHLNMMPYGVDGYLSVHMTLRPSIAQAYWGAVQKHREEHVRRIVNELDMPLFDYAINHRGGFSAVLHGMMELEGLGTRHRRLPYYSLNEDEMAQLNAFYQQLRVQSESILFDHSYD